MIDPTMTTIIEIDKYSHAITSAHISIFVKFFSIRNLLHILNFYLKEPSF